MSRSPKPPPDNKDVVPMPAGQSQIRIKGSKAIGPIVLPDDQIMSPTFPRPGETIGRKKGKQMVNLCKCCERELTKADKDKSLLSKYVKCTSCKGNVCELCRDQENRCHECYIQKSVRLEPVALMEFQRETLLRFLEILHYNEGDFEEFDKAHLVKQLLTRFRVHEMWDPRFHADPLELEQMKKEKEAMLAQEEKTSSKDSLDDFPKPRRTYSSNDILDERHHGPSKNYGNEPIVKIKHYEMKTAARPNRQEVPYTTPGPLLLQNITSPKQLEDLEVHELRSILNHYGGDPNGEKPALKYRVLQLWNNVVDKGKAERNTPSPQFRYSPTSTNLPRTFSLKDIPSTSAIEKLTMTQMRNLLRKYNHDPDMYPHRSDLEYQVQLLWNEAKRKALGIHNEKLKSGLGPARNWKSQENVQSPANKWTSAAHSVTPPKGNTGPRPYANWDAIPTRYPEHVRGEDQYSPYQDQMHKTSTLPRNPPAHYGQDPLPSSPQRKPTAPPVPPPLPPPAPHLLKSLSLHDISKPEEIASLSMKQMIELLEDHNINTDGATDKAHLQDLVKQLWFEKIMPERNPIVQHRAPVLAYHHPQNSPPHSYPMKTGFENQFGAMSVTSHQKYNDGDSSSMSTITQKTYFSQDAPYTTYQPYGAILPQDRGPTSAGAVKKVSQEMCTVCLGRPIDCVILQCGHMVSCMVCVSRMDACPLCHSEIVKIIPMK